MNVMARVEPGARTAIWRSVAAREALADAV